MASPSEKLAASLKALKKLQDQGIVAIQSSDLSRTHRERLLKTGFLQEVIKGWYIPCRPEEQAGESTAWYTSFWTFCASYLNQRFGNDWCLSPEQSLSIHAGNWTVPSQLLVRTSKGNNKVTPLPHDTSLFDTRYNMPDAKNITIENGLRIYALPSALIACTPKHFSQSPIDIKACLAMISDASDLLHGLLEGGHSTIAGRVSGALRSIGRSQIADEIIDTMNTAGYDVREYSPFESSEPLFFTIREPSPYVARLRLLWQEMRDPILENFPAPPTKKINNETYLKNVKDIYVADAYHSLSIEGYKVSPELIQRVQGGKWNPDEIESDKTHQDALAARGYWQAFQAVENSLKKVLDNINPGKVVASDHRIWYREMFSPSITVGLLKPADLAGYRSNQVYIRHSKHVPPNSHAVRDLMPVFFELLENENEPAVRIILGHFFFVYIHPYMDGNGRLGRFLMNVMLASENYPWLVVPYEMRKKYMTTLEAASTQQNIKPFSHFIADLINKPD